MAENSHSIPAQVPKVWERVPKRNPNFTGRADLLSALRKSINTVTAVVAQPRALQGLGGVGKTQLAIEYAWQYRAHYDLVWWVSADQPMLVPSALAAMAPELGLPSSTSTGVEQATQSVLRTLQNGTPYRSWLVIFDNAEDPEYIKDYIPRGPGHVLITSRNSRWSDHEATIQVDVFKREESMAFLRRRLAGAVSEAEANQLAEMLGDLPLALEQAAALLSRTLMSVDEYVGLLEKQTSRLLSLEKAPTYPQSMTAAWQVSVSQLEDRIPEAVELLRCCAFFGPEPIPRDVFRRGNRAVGPRLAPILSDTILLTNALSNLERLALVKVEPSTRTLQVHRLNQALLRDETPEDARAELRHEVHLLLAGSAPNDPDDTSKWPAFEELAAHLEPSGLIKCQEPAVRKFALDLVRYLYQRGSYNPAQILLDQYIQRWSETSGERHSDVLVARIHLGNVYRALTLYTKAHELDSQTLEMMRESLGHEHTETLWATSSYASTLRGRGDFLLAREVDEEAREAYERLMGKEDVRTLRVLNNLGVDYILTSEYAKAHEVLEEVHLKMSSAEGLGRRLLLHSWSNLGRAVRLSGQFEVATDLAEEAYGYGVAQLGDDNPATLLAAKDFAISLRRSGRAPEALELMLDTYARLRRLYGDAHADTMAAALGLSNALRVSGQHDEALEMVHRGLTHYQDVFGPDHPYTHAGKINLALLTRLGGNAAAAREISEDALAGLAERVSRDHDYALTCAINLQNDLAALGRHDAARRLGEETHRRVQTYFSPDHYLSLVCAANLSLDLRATGAEEEAGRLLAETTRRFDLVMGREHPDSLALLAGERIDCDFDPPPI
ncbi:FxSxx-COOH system tetratricopeptide repeat protein [Nonomuraea cypriaca]|uniref:FxSxx-COOH system tetratricopeptide repeat protein n=1 Tax=Nonomuraea cypriaca TaxID=1187855 RepID=UPI002E2E1DAD|nr:FxSxx-COOH system tetratricopeptide repeat protein [Nonomuraea cypriaca]